MIEKELSLLRFATRDGFTMDDFFDSKRRRFETRRETQTGLRQEQGRTDGFTDGSHNETGFIRVRGKEMIL